MQSSGDNFREGCIIKKSVIRKKKTCFRRSSRPSATTLHASCGVARRHEESTNRGAASYLDRLENRYSIRTGVQLDCWVEDAVFEVQFFLLTNLPEFFSFFLHKEMSFCFFLLLSFSFLYLLRDCMLLPWFVMHVCCANWFLVDLCARLWRIVGCYARVLWCNQMRFSMDLCARSWRIVGCDACVLWCNQLMFSMDLCARLWRMWTRRHFCNLCLRQTTVHQRDLSSNKCLKRCLRSLNVGSSCETLCLEFLLLLMEWSLCKD